MDRRYYNILNYGRPKQCLPWFTLSPETLMEDILNGTVNGYSLADFLQNDSDYITSLVYYPLDLERFMINKSSAIVILGNKTLNNYTGYYQWALWDSYIRVCEITITRKYNNFLDFAPYTKIHLYFPYFELIELEPYYVYGHTIYCLVSLDIYTGIYSLQVERDDGLILHQSNTKIGIEIPLGKTNAEEIKRNNVLQAISLIGSALNIGVGMGTGNPISTSAGITTATSGITKAIANNVNRLTSYKGASGSRNEIVCDKRIMVITETPTIISKPDVSLKGGICFDNKTLGELTGYTEIGKINFNPNGEDIYDDEINEIVDLLRSGVIL